MAVFFLPQEGCFLEYQSGDGIQPQASVRTMDGPEPVFSNLLTRWFFIGGDMVRWGRYRILRAEQEDEVIALECCPPGQEEVSDEYRQTLAIRLSGKHGGAPLSVVWRMGQQVSLRLEAKEGFREVDGVWLPRRVVEEGKIRRVEYRLLSAQRTKEPQQVSAQLPVGMTVVDTRLGQDKQVNYRLTGRLPSRKELEQLWQKRQEEWRILETQRRIRGVARWLPPLLLIGIGVLWYWRRRKENEE
jgi:hypothetical protein